jgi:hypothetical protein
VLKIQLLARADASIALAEFLRLVDRRVLPSLEERAPLALKMLRTEREAPRFSVVPMRRARVALFSAWIDADAIETWRTAPFAHGALRWSGYLVEESTPRAYHKAWPDGSPTPGVGLLTLFSRRRGLDDETFLRRWHEGHTPLALRVHPLWGYVRNVVRERLVGGSPPLDGIVEEYFREARDLSDPARLFGGRLAMLPNMVRVGIDVARFIDLRAIENYLVAETWLRSLTGSYSERRAR